MISMIKKYQSLLIFSLLMYSCSNIPISNLAPLFKTVVVGNKSIEVNEDVIASRSFSFIKVDIGRNSSAILSLLKIKDGILIWSSGDGIRLFTLNGKIIRTEGLDYNIDFISKPSFHLQVNDHKNYLLFLNPDEQVVSISRLSRDDKNFYEFREIVEVVGFNWKKENVYRVNEVNNMVIYSEQWVHPRLPKFKLSYYYK